MVPGVCPAQSLGSRRRVILNGERGFSLVEVLVAASLLAIGLIPVAYIQSSGLRSGVSSYSLLSAANLAAEVNDAVRAVSYVDPRLADTSGAFVTPAASLNLPSLPGLTCTWKITNNTVLANTKQIDVRVSWNEYGLNRTYTLSTIKAVGS